MSSPYAHEENSKCSLSFVIRVLDMVILCECTLSIFVTLLQWYDYCLVDEELVELSLIHI